jgi:DNA-binding NarL/FixJ family response regulator
VVVADDDVLLREGLASLLERSGFDVAGQAGDAPQLMALVRELRPELVIVDIRMPPRHSTEGLDAAREIRALFPDIAILVLSAHVEVEHAMDLVASGQRSGYLLKSRVVNVDDFIETLWRVVRGGSVVDPELVKELVAARRVSDPLDVLSSREREVLALMAEGRSNSGIARELWVTEGTVEKHVRSILLKLRLPEADDVHRRVLAVLRFLDTQQLRLPPEDPADALRRQLRLCQESCGRAFRDQVRVVGFGRRRDHDYGHGAPVDLGEAAGHVEPVFVSERDVNQNDVRPQRGRHLEHFGAVSGGAHDRYALLAEQRPCAGEDGSVVVHQQAAHEHGPSLTVRRIPRIAASRNACFAASCNTCFVTDDAPAIACPASVRSTMASTERSGRSTRLAPAAREAHHRQRPSPADADFTALFQLAGTGRLSPAGRDGWCWWR